MTPKPVQLADAIAEYRAERLTEHERIIQAGFDAMTEAIHSLTIIKNERLFEGQYPDFDTYCQMRWGQSLKRFYQLRLFLDTRAQIEAETGVVLPNESAGRTLRTFPASLRPAIALLAQRSAERQGAALDGGHIKRAGDVLTEATITGAVDTGGGDSTPFDVAMDAAASEASERRKQYQADDLRAEAGVTDDSPPVWVALFAGRADWNYRQLRERLTAADMDRLRDYFLGE